MARYDRGYDYGLRGWRETAPPRGPVRTRWVGRGGYDRGYGPGPLPNRVTARYNLDYVREQHPGEHPVNYTPYGGDRVGRIGDMREYAAPYFTLGGTRTWRGGGYPIDWARGPRRYDRDYPPRRRGYDRGF
jgi:hypothetical protein